jgi:hydroxymethylbilane synthase
VNVRALRIGTRASALALWQARRVAELIRAQPDAPVVELVHIRTEGDARTDVPLWAVDGRGFFTREIDRALLAQEIDIAVHSLKDLTTTLDAGLVLAAVLEREDPRDALVARDADCLAALPRGARVGTSSLRRRAFLAHARADLVLQELRGNVPTRIERLHEGRYDAIILATAGLKRLELTQHITEHLDPEAFPPAVSQGAIGVCARTDDRATARWLRALDHFATRVACTAERALLRHVEGGCQVPLGALAHLAGRSLRLAASVCALDGTQAISARGHIELETPSEALESASRLGDTVGADLLARGASRIIDERRALSAAVDPP